MRDQHAGVDNVVRAISSPNPNPNPNPRVNQPYPDQVIRVINTAAVEYPMTVSVVPHSMPRLRPQEAYELQGGYTPGLGGYSVRDRALSRGGGVRVWHVPRVRPASHGRRGRGPQRLRHPWGSVREAALRSRRGGYGGVGYYGAGFRASRSARIAMDRWADVGGRRCAVPRRPVQLQLPELRRLQHRG